jgi:glycerol dehydrogenase
MYAALIGPAKYVQGRGALAEIGTLLRPLGERALILADKNVWDLLQPTVGPAFARAHVPTTTALFGGECSSQEIERVLGLAREARADVIVGVGGGKALDAAKAVGAGLGANWAVVPTIASTDAPTSALSVIYTPDGIFERYLFHPKNPDLVLVDTEVIARAPARFMAAGIGDGLSTWVEARANLQSLKPAMSGGVATRAAAAIAELCWKTLFTHGEAGLMAVAQRAVTPALDATIEAATLLSGLGFESCGLAAAHAIHNGITVLHDETHAILHGEKVAFGTIAQLTLEGRPLSEVNELIAFCRAIGLPTTLAELNLAEVGRERLMRVAEAACAPGETIHNMPFAVTPPMVLDAILTADAYGRAFVAR